MELAASTFEWIKFDRAGTLTDPSAVGRIQEATRKGGVTDLVVLSHGWNNDLIDARNLYERLWKQAATALSGVGRSPQSFLTAGVLWHAKAYDAVYDGAAEFVDAAAQERTQKIGASGGSDDTDVPPSRLDQIIGQVEAFAASAYFPPLASVARAAAYSKDEMAAFNFFRSAMAVLEYAPHEQDSELNEDRALFRAASTCDGANDLLDAFSAPRTIDLATGVGRAQGLGAVIQSVFSGPRSGVIWALNKMTYYTMKKRAGLAGRRLASILGSLRLDRDLRLHLVGHSFGARLVTSTADALVTNRHLDLRSLTLLQAAYSQNGLTAGKGPFASVVGKLSGPISVTHTHNDKACTIAYPIASRLNGDSTQSLGDKDDPFGAMGANGPQLTGTMVAHDCVDTAFAPVPGKVNRFLSDGYVVKTELTDAHNNVTNEQCGRLVAANILA